MANTTSATPPNPTTPAFSDDKEWITAYLAIHVLSDSSRRYSFLLWITVVFIFLGFAILHWTGSRGGFIGALWSKWTLRRRTWRKKHSLAVAKRKNRPHQQPEALPSNAQLLCLTILFLATIALATAGPDYIAPGVKIWQFYRPSSNSTTSASFGPPQYTIWKAWWTAGGRFGQIAFALLPLCVLFALKAPPFAIFAIPFMVQLHFDKLAWLHRWSGRLIWFMSATHVVLWTIQLAKDRRQGTGRMAIVYAWLEMKFIWGWIAFGFLTLLIACASHPLRKAYYEVFYLLHILLVPLFLIASAFHHPPVAWWCWAALSLWIGERLWRGTFWLYNNGYFGEMSPKPPTSQIPPGKEELPGQMNSPQQFNAYGQSLVSPNLPYLRQSSSSIEEKQLLYSPQGHSRMSSAGVSLSMSGQYVPPRGYAHAELLAGQTVRLRFVSPGFLSWAPGQHFLISIPSVSKFTSHPFTIASVCDEQGPDAGRVTVFLVRAKDGWTKDLWNAVVDLTTSGQAYPPGEHPGKGVGMPTRGVLMRMYVDGPYGSSVRARWGTHSTVLVIAGGTGVSFGLSALMYVCMCLSGREGRHLGGRPGGWGEKEFKPSRVRFVWLVREFSHIQWGATILRQCLAMVPSPNLQIDIFVTNFKPLLQTAPSQPSTFPYGKGQNDMAPPNPGFAQHDHHPQRDSQLSLDAGDPFDPYVDLGYYTGEPEELDYSHDESRESADPYADHETHMLDLTNFDGDVDAALPGEEAINRTVKKQGKLRREKTRKATMEAAKEKLQEKRADPDDTQVQIHLPDAQIRSPGHTRMPSGETYMSTDRLLSDASLVLAGDSGLEQQLSPKAEVAHGHLAVPHIEAPRRSPRTRSPSRTRGPSRTQTPSVSPRASRQDLSEGYFNDRDSRIDTASIREMLTPVMTGAAGKELRLEIEEQEMQDVSVVSEHARPGKPKLDLIVADEVESSEGSTIVACCGPTSLNAMVRKIIAAKIDPTRIRQGDMRGAISLISEEFKY